MNYVAGLLFNEQRSIVALVKKQKPDWQAGKLNAIGGKIEDGETPIEAMVREFKEETSVEYSNWELFCILKWNGGSVYFFKGFSDIVIQCQTMEAEEILLIHKDVAHVVGCIPNLKWLIPLALDNDNVTAEVHDLS